MTSLECLQWVHLESYALSGLFTNSVKESKGLRKIVMKDGLKMFVLGLTDGAIMNFLKLDSQRDGFLIQFQADGVLMKAVFVRR